MKIAIQHLYRPSHEGDGLLYAWFSSMHTRVDILLYSQKPEEELMSVVERIHAALSYLEKIANYFDPASELAVINRTASICPVILSRQLYTMIDLCMEYHGKTSGCFDVTVHSENYNPDTIHSVYLSAEERSIFFLQPGITINLSGFLKGYALETVRAILNTCCIENALINMGNSSVLALGDHPAGTGWKVNFGNRLETDKIGMKQSVLLCNECLTTSGNESDGRKHIMSPHDASFVEGIKQIAVVTKNGTVGEILSTALFAASPEQREALLVNLRPLLIDYFLIGY